MTGVVKIRLSLVIRFALTKPFGTTPFPLSYVRHNEKRKSPNSFESGLFGI